MIEVIEGFPEYVVAVTAKGQVTRKDYEQVLIPQVEAALKRHNKIRLYYELGPQFSEIAAGAAWEDFKVGVEHLTHWERAAIVTDVDWIKNMVSAFRFLMPGQVRAFAVAQADEARTWLEAAGG